MNKILEDTEAQVEEIEDDDKLSDLEVDSNTSFHVHSATLKGRDNSDDKEEEEAVLVKRKSDHSISSDIPNKKLKKSTSKWRLI